MHVDFLSLECFLAICETGNFSRASKKLNRTQSAISQKISQLESILKCKLFIRNREVILTTSGEKLLFYANEIFKLHHQMIESLKEPELSGNLRFGLPEDFATVYLSKILCEFTQKHPMIKPHIECDLTLNLLEKFKKGKFDLVLLKLDNKDSISNGITIWKEKLVWVGKDNYINDLLKADTLNLVLSPKPCVYRSRALEALKKENLKWDIVYSSQSYISSMAAVKAGIGITVLPKNMVPEGLSIIRNPKLPDLKDTHAILLIKDKNLKPAVIFANTINDQLNPKLHTEK